MGCGCGKKAKRPAARVPNTAAATSRSATRAEQAKSFQSATMSRPKAPVTTTRKTV